MANGRWTLYATSTIQMGPWNQPIFDVQGNYDRDAAWRIITAHNEQIEKVHMALDRLVKAVDQYKESAVAQHQGSLEWWIKEEMFQARQVLLEVKDV